VLFRSYRDYLGTAPNSTQRLTVAAFSEFPNAISPVVKISGLGSNCSLQGAARMSSLVSLNQSTNNSFYSDNNNQFYIRLKNSRPLNLINPTYNGLSDYAMGDRFRIVCANPIVSSVQGILGDIQIKNSAIINGWTCDYGKEHTLNVHVYANAPYGQGGVLIANGVANQSSESNVGFACASSLNHRFNIPLTMATAKRYADKPIYVYAISSLGNRLLSRSGTVRMPTIHMNGYVDTRPQTGTTQASLKGWACETGQTASLNVHVYAGGEAGKGGQLVASTVANLNSEQAVKDACHVSSGKYRFNIARTVAQTNQIRGKKLYFYGISKTGKSNMLLNGSGQILVP